MEKWNNQFMIKTKTNEQLLMKKCSPSLEIKRNVN